ncbi:early activation antigen CD69-like [Elgaria multicarinata webbii]|uniref:early activation antigen CD69-like n=1 Tax=Elgaria multicarinata webbii TaxID=159646 RepID=UPI002FCCC670
MGMIKFENPIKVGSKMKEGHHFVKILPNGQGNFASAHGEQEWTSAGINFSMKGPLIVVLAAFLLALIYVGIHIAVSSGHHEEWPTPLYPSGVTPSPQVWMTYGKRTYFFSETEANWTASQNFCSSYGGSLVILDTREEKDFVMRFKGSSDSWIGLQRKEVGQPWKQPDGSLFSNWFRIRGDGLCSYVTQRVVNSTWCYNSRYWICSKPAHTA